MGCDAIFWTCSTIEPSTLAFYCLCSVIPANISLCRSLHRSSAMTRNEHPPHRWPLSIMNNGRTCEAVRPLPAATCRGGVRATRQRGTGRRRRLSIMALARRRYAPERRAYLRSSAPPACGNAPGDKEHLKARSKGIGNDCSGGVTREILRAINITHMI